MQANSLSQVSELLPDTPDFKAQKGRRGGTTEEEMSALSRGTACWGLRGQGTPKDSEKCSDGKCLPACVWERLWLKCTGEGDGLLEIKGGDERFSQEDTF